MTHEQNVFFEQFYRKHFSQLVAYAYRFLQNWDDAKVATQEAFLVGMKKFDQFHNSGEKQLAWMKSVIRKTASNMNHTRRLREEIVVPMETLLSPPSTYDNHEDEDVDALLDHCAEILKPEEYSLFIEVIWKMKPYPQVSQEFGISEWACRKRIHRILEKLNKNWDKEISK